MLIISLIYFSVLSLFSNAHTNSLSPSGPAVFWNISATTSSTKKTKSILKQVVGCAGEGKLHAIMGPSGSGKTTLLNVLAGVIPKKSMKLTGSLDIATGFAPERIYVQQEDLLFAQLSVIETLDTAASLKSPDQPNKSSVQKLVLDLGLKNVRQTRVGDAKTRGVSGGEKKRLSIGNELVGNYIGGRLIFADEPTSGLDSFQAQRVVQLLRDLASDGNTVLCSLHQPRSSIMDMFDEITFLSEGKVMYSGPIKDLSSYFHSLGFPCPNNVNIAEHVIDLISINYSSTEAEEESRNRIKKFASGYEKLLKSQGVNTLIPSKKISLKGYNKNTEKAKITSKIKRTFIRFGLLLQRAWRQVTRDKGLNIARFSSSLFSALLFGAIYFKLGNKASTVADRLGLLQVAAVNTAMTALIKATTSFVTEKLIVQRERRSGSYAVAPYFFSKLLAEFPLSAFFPCLTGSIIYKLCGLNPAPGKFRNFLMILTVESLASSALGMAVGSFAPSVEAAIAIAPAIMVVFIVFGGLYVVNSPPYLSWLAKVSLIRWAYEALCVNEMTGLEFIAEKKYGPLAVTKGEQVLESQGYSASTIKNALLAQGGIILFNYLFTYLMLIFQTPSTEPIQEDVANGVESKKNSELSLLSQLTADTKNEISTSYPKVSYVTSPPSILRLGKFF